MCIKVRLIMNYPAKPVLKKLLLPYGPTTHLNWEKVMESLVMSVPEVRMRILLHMPKDDKAKVQPCPPKYIWDQGLTFVWEITIGQAMS